MQEQARLLCKATGYRSAGTVEMLCDSKQNFFFLEMNTRLQVEHTVTELITGIDIVKQMIHIAEGRKLDFTQDDVKITGWAKECRIYAEDPSRGFLPSSGKITEYIEPPKSDSIRIDSGVDGGSEVSMFYDPMIAKICSYGPTRLESIENMRNALSRYVILGVSHNIRFLEALLNKQRYVDGDINTNFIQEEYPEGFGVSEITSESTIIFIATAIHIFITEQSRAANINDATGHKKVEIGTRWIVNIEDKFYPVIIQPVENGFKIRQGTQRISVISNWRLGSRIFSATINGNSIHVKLKNTPVGYQLVYRGLKVKAQVRSPRISELEALVAKKPKNITSATELIAPLSGQIISIKVAPGDKILKGQELISLVAMKMENIILAENDAEIESIAVNPNDYVNNGQLLITFK
jgi:propionyl-CoA carboxylase alpha chain